MVSLFQNIYTRHPYAKKEGAKLYNMVKLCGLYKINFDNLHV